MFIPNIPWTVKMGSIGSVGLGVLVFWVLRANMLSCQVEYAVDFFGNTCKHIAKVIDSRGV